MRTGLLIARKDLRQRIRDRSALIYGIIAPLGLAAIFSMILGPISDREFHAEYVYVNKDGGPVAQGLIGILDKMRKDDVIDLRKLDSIDKAEKQVELGSDPFAEGDKADAAFIIPKGFSQRVLAGRGGKIEVIGARGSELGAQVAAAVANAFASEVGAVDVAVKTALPPGEQVDRAMIGGLVQQASATKNPVSVEDITAKTKQLDSTTYIVAGMAVFFLFFTVQFGVSGLLEERQLHTMARLMAAPINRRSILVGKAITSFVLGVVSMAVLVIVTTLALGADWGDPLGVAVLVVAAVFSAMGILAIVASVAKTQEQASIFQTIIALILGLMGGTFFQISQVGGILSQVSLISPHAWFLRGLGDLQGGNVADVLPAVGALLAFGFVTGATAWVFLRRTVNT